MKKIRHDTVEGKQTLFATTSALMQYVWDIGQEMDDKTRSTLLAYLKLRASTTITKSDVQQFITLVNYEITCEKLTKQLEAENKEELINVRKVKEIATLLGNMLNQAQLLRTHLGVTLTQLHGISRERVSLNASQSAVVDILCPKDLNEKEVTDLDEAQEKVKIRLLKKAGSL